MRRNTNHKQNILLAAGMLLVIVGLFILSLFFAKTTVVHSYWPILLLIIGSIFIYIVFTSIHSSFLLFVGLNIVFTAIVMLFTTTHFLPVTIRQLWPLLCVSSGIALILCSFYNNSRLRAVYVIPALLLIILGGFFLLFSFDIITISFSRFVSLCWPVLLILLGSVLMGVFFYQRKFPESFPHPQDDPDSDMDTCGGSDSGAHK